MVDDLGFWNHLYRVCCLHSSASWHESFFSPHLGSTPSDLKPRIDQKAIFKIASEHTHTHTYRHRSTSANQMPQL